MRVYVARTMSAMLYSENCHFVLQQKGRCTAVHIQPCPLQSALSYSCSHAVLPLLQSVIAHCIPSLNSCAELI